MPHIDWMAALQSSSRHTQMVLPGRAPVTDLVAPVNELKLIEDLAAKLKDLRVGEVGILKSPTLLG